jgi:hypothetical protein
MNNSDAMLSTTRIVACALALLSNRLRVLAMALAFATAFVGANAAQAQCPPSWLPAIGTPGIDGGVTSLALLPGGDVIVGGSFASAGGVSTNGIARYNPSSGAWSESGSGGISGTVSALAVLPDGDVIVGGGFGIAGGVEAYRIARYNPSTGVWSALGAGVYKNSTGGGSVTALSVLPGGDVVVGGVFDTAGDVPANNIARYNPSTGLWSALGAGTNGSVLALAVLPGGDVIAGGDFTSAGGVPANRIARYNPSTGVWSALGSGIGFNAVAFSLAVLPGGDVIVGGVFDTAGDVPAKNIARYNPSTGAWSALGSGNNDFVHSLAVLPGGDVIVGGNFTTAGVWSANNIARYNPSTGVWSALGPGTRGPVRALAVLPSGGVIVGGSWWNTVGLPSSIARYLPGAPPPSIQWQPVNLATTPSGTAVFSIVASANGGSAVFTYQWFKNGAFISPTTNPSAATPVLVLNGVQAGDLGSYTCRATNTCGSVMSNPAVLSFVNPSCGPSDIAGPGQSPGSDGQLTADDIILFLNRFFAGC